MWKGPDEAESVPAAPPVPATEPATESEPLWPQPPATAARPAPATDEEDPLASLPADFAAFLLTQTHPRSGDAKAEPFEQQRQYKTRICIYGDACPYGPGRCFFAHDAAELRPPQARWWLPEYKTKPCRYAISECPFYADGRCQYAHTVEELQYVRPPPSKTQGKKYKTRMCRYGVGTCPYGVGCSYAHSAEELRPLEPDEPPGEPTDVVSRLERLRAIRDSGSVSAAEFEELKQQVLREPGSFATETPALTLPPDALHLTRSNC